MVVRERPALWRTQWLTDGKVTRRAIRLHRHDDAANILWAHGVGWLRRQHAALTGWVANNRQSGHSHLPAVRAVTAKLKIKMLVSVYIPTKNRLELLIRAINSVKAQTYKNIEIIIADDGSTDGTRDYLAQQMELGNLKAVFHDKSRGACAARNSAIGLACGKFVTGLDDDDYFLSTQRIELFVKEWEKISQDTIGIFDSLKVKTKSGILERHCSEIVTYDELRHSNLVGNQVFALRSSYIESGLFDIEMPAWQDWDLWLRMCQNNKKFININKFTYMVDEIHDADRITTRNPDTIRTAMKRLHKKLNDVRKVSLRESSSLIIFMHSYPQIEPKINEVLKLLIAFRIKSALWSTKKMIF